MRPSKRKRCKLCRKKLPAAEIHREIVHRAPTDGSFEPIYEAKDVCRDCVQADKKELPRTRNQLRDRLREHCQTWLRRAPVVDPADWPVKPDIVPLDTAVEQCLDAFYNNNIWKSVFIGDPTRLPEGHTRILTKTTCFLYYISYWEGSIYQTPNNEVFFVWTHVREIDTGA